MRPLREGFTTGSCAAACALASCLWRRDGECPDRVEITVPEGRTFTPRIYPLFPYRCAVQKDAGDDPDVTNGAQVWAEAEILDTPGEIAFFAGEGVGVITKPGLKLAVGEAAINPVPREMIAGAVRQVYPARAARVTVGIAGGRSLAQRTFNPRLGIVGGLSILGTTGVVRPMSEAAMQDVIRLEMEMRRAGGAREIGLVFGSQGEKALAARMPRLGTVQMGNFVGFALDAAAELRFDRVLMAGQPGKLVKVAGGCMQTHSRYGDGRRETLAAHLALMGAPRDLLQRVMDSPLLDSLIPQIREEGYEGVWTRLCRAAAAYCEARTRGNVKIQVLMLSAEGQCLGRSKGE